MLEELSIWSFFGQNWTEQIGEICGHPDVSDALCKKLKSTLDDGVSRSEMSVKQLEYMWQESYTKTFNEFSDTFEEDGWSYEIDVTGVDTRMLNYYAGTNSKCKTEVNQAVMDDVPGQLWRSTFPKTTHRSIQGNQGDAGANAALWAAVEIGSKDENGDDLCAAF